MGYFLFCFRHVYFAVILFHIFVFSVNSYSKVYSTVIDISITFPLVVIALA